MSNILGAVLAGGQSLRMGVPDKFLLQYQGRSLLKRVMDQAQSQVNELVINANGDPSRLAEFQRLVIADIWPQHQGPLAGIISVMSWAQKARENTTWIATFAADTPYFPPHLVATLEQRAVEQNLLVAYPVNRGQAHYTFALWSTALLPHLLIRFDQGERSLHGLMATCPSGGIGLEGDPRWFLNINTPDDWRRLESRNDT